MKLNLEINKLQRGELSRIYGILAIDKPKGMRSHSIVNLLRKKLDMRRIGHAGALDPFASGLMILLIGRKATKLSNEFLNLGKEYKAEILFGISTDSGDTEGEILEIREGVDIKEVDLVSTLKSLQPSYEQYVPVYSSVKVDGNKLRQVARKYADFKVVEKENIKYVKFFDKEGELKLELELPKREVEIKEIEILELKKRDLEVVLSSEDDMENDFFEKTDTFIKNHNFDVKTSRYFQTVKIRVKCSKGTYIRQLGIDIGRRLGIPSMLVNLRRTEIGDISIEQSLTIEDLDKMKIF